MRRVLAGAAVAAALMGSASLSYAQTTSGCDSYSGACVLPTSTTKVEPQVLPTRQSRPGALPLTGGELVMLIGVGSIAVGGGSALVLAGRRRKSA